MFKQNNLSKSANGTSFAKNTNGKKLAGSGALFPLMNMDNIDADEIINSSKNEKLEAELGKSGKKNAEANDDSEA